MPNWIDNRVSITAPGRLVTDEEVAAVRALLINPAREFTDEYGPDAGVTRHEPAVDFEILVPMPPEILATFAEGGSTTAQDAFAWKYRVRHGETVYAFTPSIEQQAARFESLLTSSKSIDDPERLANAEARIQRALEGAEAMKVALDATGFGYWYPWAIENWGTKWNPSELSDFGHNEFRFNTAWSTPRPIWNELIDRLPDGVQVDIEWSDEGGPQGHVWVNNLDGAQDEARPDKVYDDYGVLPEGVEEGDDPVAVMVDEAPDEFTLEDHLRIAEDGLVILESLKPGSDEAFLAELEGNIVLMNERIVDLKSQIAARDLQEYDDKVRAE